jgi:hypothetical protein
MRWLRRRRPSRRAQQLEAIYRSLLHGTDWERLSRRDQDELRRRWGKQLASFDDAFIERLASPQPGSLCVRTDESLQLFVTTQTQSAPKTGRSDPLLALVQSLNEADYLLHGHDAANNPIITDMAAYTTHQVVLGVSGVGKSTYMANTFVQLAAQGGPMLLIDPHEGLIEAIMSRLPKHRWKDVVYVDPTDTKRTWGTNVLQNARGYADENDPEYAITSQYASDNLVKTLVQALTSLQEDTSGFAPGPFVKESLEFIFKITGRREDTSLVDGKALTMNADTRDIVARTIADDLDLSYWTTDILGQMDEGRLSAIRNKLSPFTSPMMVNTLSRRDECTPLQDLMAQNKIIIFDIPTSKIPQLECSLLGYVVLNLAMFAVERRTAPPGEELRPFYLMVDEFSLFASVTTKRFFAEARKRRAGLIVGFQQLSQLDPEIQAALFNAATWTIFRTNPDDAAILAKYCGLLDDMGRPLIQEFTRLPNYEAKFAFGDRDLAALRPTERREVVGLRCLDPLPRHEKADAIIAHLIEYSRRVYWKPNQASDQQTIYRGDDASNRQVLEATLEATLAIQKGSGYQLTATDERAQYALRHGLVTQPLMQAILKAKGIDLLESRLGQLARTLARNGYTRRVPVSSGLTTTEITPLGHEALREFVVPKKSSNEGKPEHRDGLLRLHSALCALGPLDLVAPSQQTNEYTPDLVLNRPAQVPTSLAWRLTDKKEIHFQVEYATRSQPDKVMANLAHALKAGADPVLVVAAQPNSADAEVLAVANRLEQALRTGTVRSSDTNAAFLQEQGLRAFRIWWVDPRGELLECDLATRSLRPVREIYMGAGKPVPPLRSAPPPPPLAPPAVPQPSSAEAEAFLNLVAPLTLNAPGGELPMETILAALGSTPGAPSLTTGQIDALMQGRLSMTRRQVGDRISYRV